MPVEASISGLPEFLSTYASLLASLYVQANAARWNLSHEEFAAALYRSAMHRFGAELLAGEAAEVYFRALHLEDLALACALRRECEAAWEEFVASYRPVLHAAARAIVGAAGEERARELADSLFAELYGLDRSGGARKNSLLDYFHGRSRLSTWLRSVLAQRYVDTLRGSQRLEPLDDEKTIGGEARLEGANAAVEDMDPDRVRLLPRLLEAISAALEALPAADRLLLSLYYVQGLTLAQIARMRGVHEATTSRRLQSIRLELRRNVERLLAQGNAAQNGRPAAKGLSAAEIRRCMEYAPEDSSFDLSSHLNENAVPGTNENDGMARKKSNLHRSNLQRQQSVRRAECEEK